MCAASSWTSSNAPAHVIAKHAITQTADLYIVGKKARAKAPEERVALWQEKAKPIFDDPEAWLQTQLPKIAVKRTKPAVRF